MSAPLKNAFSGITKNVVVLGVASFFTDVSSEMLYPIIPIFLTTTLGAPASVLGLIEGVAESTASLLKLVSGWASDKLRKRRPFVVGGYSLSSIAKPILFLAYAWPTVLAARFLDRLGKGLRTSARDAMIADSTAPEFRGKAFGFHRAMDSIGACLGPLLAILFLAIFKENLRMVFLIAFVPAALSVATLIFFLKETETETLSKPIGKVSSSQSGKCHHNACPPVIASTGDISRYCEAAKRPKQSLKRFLFVSFIFAIGNSSDAFLIMRAKGLGLSLVMVIFAYVLYNIIYSAVSTPAGSLSDKMPRKAVMAAGYLIFAFVYLGFGLTKDPRWVWFLFPLYGFYIAMTEGVGKAFVTDMVKSERRGTALGMYNGLLGIAAFFASLIAGILWSCLGPSAPFFYGAGTAVASSIALLLLV